MASYIAVPRDLTKVKSKVVFNLTKRQLICFSLAALIGVPSFFLFRHFGSTSMATMGMMVIMMPMFFLAIYEKDGMYLETILAHFVQAVIIRPGQRPYKTDNYYAALMREMEAEREVEAIVRNSEKNVHGKKRCGGNQSASPSYEGRTHAGA